MGLKINMGFILKRFDLPMVNQNYNARFYKDDMVSPAISK